MATDSKPNPLIQAYTRIEESFYNIMDSVETRGIPVYNYIEFLEQKGIPAFPFTVGLFLLIIFALLLAFVFSPTSMSVVPTFKSDSGMILNDVTLIITGSNNQTIFSDTIDNETEITLPSSVRPGDTIVLTGIKDGYSDGTSTLGPLIGGPNGTIVVLASQVDYINGSVTLMDKETGTAITEAVVNATFEGVSVPIEAINLGNGKFGFSGIPKNKPVLITILPKNYEAPSRLEHTFLSDGEDYRLELVPKAEFSGGSSVLTVTVKEANGQLVPSVTIQLYNAVTGARITNEIADDGVLHQELPVGTAVRVVASKQGYATYDSSDSNGSKTLREREESFNVTLLKGGQTQNVLVKDASGLFMIDALVSIWNDDFEIIDQNATGLTGSVVFKGLSQDGNYVVGAFKENYLPKSQVVQLGKDSTLVLEAADPNNSSFVTIRVQDEFGASVSNAKVDLFKQNGNDSTPLGIPQLETDITGILQVRLALGTALLVVAKKEGLEGVGTLSVVPGSNNVLNVMLVRDPTVKTLRFTDLAGTELVDGQVSVTCNDGSSLFDGNLQNARVTFDAGNCIEGIVHIESAGHVQDEVVNFQGPGIKNIIFEGKEISDLAPLVEFKGFQNENEETVLGIAADSDAYAVFSITWPKGLFRGGLHVRVGDDSVKNGLSQPVTIQGFSGNQGELLFSKTYNPPSNELVDLQNVGQPGEPNKWVNAYWTNPTGQTTVKVKLHGSSSLTRDEVPLHYRAWVDSAGRFYRNPSDDKLGLAAGNAALQGLYAKTTILMVPTFDQTTQVCKQSICVYLALQNEAGQPLDFKDFEASLNQVYTLNATVSTSLTGTGSLTAEVLSPPYAALDSWNQTSSNIVSTLPDFSATSAQTTLLGSGLGNSQSYSIRLRGTKAGFAKLRLTAKMGDQTVVESRAFRVFVEQPIKVSLSPNPGRLGEKIQLNVREDNNSNKPVEKALVIVRNAQGEEVYRLVGDSTPLKGKNGRYVIPAVLKAGAYRISVEQKEYSRVELPYEIALTDAVEFSGDAYVRIPTQTKSGVTTLQVLNKTALNWTDVSFSIKGFENEPDFQASVSGLSLLSASQSGEVRITGTYSGQEERARVSGTIEAVGVLDDGSIAIAKTPIVLDYNPKMDPNCLEVSPSPLRVTLFSESGSERQVSLTVRNRCTQNPEESIVLRSSVEGQVPQTEMSIAVPEISVLSGEEKTVQVLITNKVDRLAVERQQFQFSITLTDAGVTKTIPLIVDVFSKRLALSAPNTVTVFVAQTVRGQKEIAVAPIAIRNLSNLPLENITLNLRSGEIEGISLVAQPVTGVPRLNPNQSAPVFIQVTSDVDKSKVVKDELIIRGSLDGKAYDLAKVNIIVNASAPSCLKVNTARVSFEAEKSELGRGAETATVTIQNNCGQEVRVVDLNPKSFGSNILTFGPVDNFVNIIPIGGTSQYKIILSKQQGLKTSGSIFFTGQLLAPNVGAGGFKYVTSDPIPILINLGSVDGEDSLAENEIELPVCEDPNGVEKKTVKFPKISTGGNDCSSAYCDASQAAVFILDKIQKMYQVAESKMLEKNRTTLGTDCANKAACDLSSFGVETEKFNLYLQNDRLTPELIRATIEKNDRFSSLRGFDPILGGIGGFGFGRSIQLPTIEGCGKYPLELSGVVEVVGVTAQEGRETFNVRFKEGSGRKVTAECESKIQNVANFLPSNHPAQGGVSSYATRQGTWLGMIDSPRELQKEGQTIAQLVFGTKDRYANNVSNVNHIYVRTSTSVSRLVQIEMDLSSGSGPARIEASINEDLFKQNKEEASREVGQILASLKNKNPAAGSCISRDESYLSLVSGDSQLGGLPVVSDCRPVTGSQVVVNQSNPNADLKWPLNEVRVTGSIEQCCLFKVTGVSRTQTILPYLGDGSFTDLDAKTMIGVSSYTFKVKKENEDSFTSIDSSSSTGYPLIRKTAVVDGKNQQVFEREFQFCATGNAVELGVLAQQGGLKAYVVAEDVDRTSNTSDKLESNPKELTVNACGIHPYTLVDTLTKETKSFAPNRGELPTKTFVATVVWKGDPNPVLLNQVLANTQDLGVFFRTSDGKNLAADLTNEKELAEGKLKPIQGYLVGCFVTHLALDLVASGVTLGATAMSFGSSVIDCGIPAISAIRSVQAETSNAGVFDRAVAGSLDWAINGVRNLLGFEDGASDDTGDDLVGKGVTLSALRAAFVNIPFVEKMKGFITSLGYKEAESLTDVKDTTNYPSISIQNDDIKLQQLTQQRTLAQDELAQILRGAPGGIDKGVQRLVDAHQKTIADATAEQAKLVADKATSLGKTTLTPRELGDLKRTNAWKSTVTQIQSAQAELSDIFARTSVGPVDPVRYDQATKNLQQIEENLSKTKVSINEKVAQLKGQLAAENEKLIKAVQEFEAKRYTSGIDEAKKLVAYNHAALSTLENAEKQIAQGSLSEAEELLKVVSGKAKNSITAVANIDPATGRVALAASATSFDDAVNAARAAGSVKISSGYKLFSGKGFQLVKGFATSLGIGVAANAVGYGVYHSMYSHAQINNGITIDSTPGQKLVNYSTYQITIDKSVENNPKWKFELLDSGLTSIPDKAVVLPEQCDADAFDTPLDYAASVASGGPVAPAVTP